MMYFKVKAYHNFHLTLTVQVANFKFVAREDDELSLEEGTEVTLMQKADGDWWLGSTSDGRTGWFPSNYVVQRGAEFCPAVSARSTISHASARPPNYVIIFILAALCMMCCQRVR
jgi:hypothetical protein